VRISATPRERRELLDKIAPQLTPEEAAALWSVAAGKGEPVALARALRQVVHLLVKWLGETPLVNTVLALAELSDETLTEVEVGSIGQDRAVFLGRYMKQIMFDSPERRADFQRRAIAGLRKLGAGQSERCGSLFHLDWRPPWTLSPTAAVLRRCLRCYQNPPTRCELRIVDQSASAVLDEQKAEQRYVRATTDFEKPIWTVWHVLSWIVFRRPEQICVVVHEGEFEV